MASFHPPNPRYRGKPLLRLLEIYVLWAIGELQEKESMFMEEVTPNLQSTYKRGGNWQSIIAAEMEYPSELPSQLRDLWNHECQDARSRGVVLSPQQFAETIVDEKLWTPEDRN